MFKKLNKIKEKIENYITKKDKSNFLGEVYTKEETIIEMLNLIDNSFWKNKNLKILDPCNGLGNFQVHLIEKLMIGLSDIIKNEVKRYDYIINNILYTADIQKESQDIYFGLFGSKKYNHFLGDFLSIEFDDYLKNENINQFDLVIGNPPYQKGDNSRSSFSVYHKFVEKSYMLGKKVIMITPRKWYTNPSMSIFRSNMISDYGLKTLNDRDNIFDNVEIKGNVCFFLLEKGYKGKCLYNLEEQYFNFGYIFNIKENSFLKKVITKTNINFGKKLFNDQHFDIKNNDNRLINNQKNNEYIVCYVSKRNGLKKYIHINYIKENTNINKYKVLIPTASGNKNNIGILGNIIIANKGEVCSRSYVHFAFDTRKECINFISYLNTDIAKYLISLKKQTHLVKKDTFSFLPIIPLNKKWNNANLKSYLGI